MLIIVILTKIIILKKKSLVYKYVDKHKELTASDYFDPYDGMWLFERIEYEQIIKENREDEWYILSEQKTIKTLIKVVLCLFAFIISLLTILKIFGLI